MELSYYKSMEPFWGVWRIRRLIGEGSFGKVFEIEREDFGRTYKAALKAITIPQSQSELKSVLADGMDLQSATNYYKSFVEEVVDEFALMAGLKGNSNIVSYEDHMVIERKDGVGWDILIRMELLTPLLDYTTSEAPMGRGDVIRLGIDICRALEYCRKMNVIHRDIKPENIFISVNGDYKLGDFGIARTVEKTTSGLSRKGTYVYMAPEVYKGEEYGASVDIYSLGIVLYRLLNRNRAPFFPDFPAPITHSDRESAIARRIGGQPVPMPCDARDALGEIVIKACAYAPGDRYHTPEEMRAALEQVLAASSEPAIHVTKEKLQALEEKGEANPSEEQTELLVRGPEKEEEEKTEEDAFTEKEISADEDRTVDEDLTVSLIGEEPERGAAKPEPKKTERQQPSEKEEPEPPVGKQPVQREKPERVSAAEGQKKKKTWLIVGIVIIAIGVIFYIIAWLTAGGDVAAVETDTDTSAPQSVFAESEESAVWESSEAKQEETGESAGAEETEPESMENGTDNPLLYGAYVYDGAISWSENPEKNFELDMEYEDHPFGYGSVLPAVVCFSPDGAIFEGPDLYETGTDLEMSPEELFHKIAVEECGEGIAEETAAFYQENIQGKMDVVQTGFAKVGGEIVESYGYYRLEGSALEYGCLTRGIGNHLTMETKTYDICFNGRNLELTRDGVTRTLVPYDFSSMAEGEPVVLGHATSSSGVVSVFTGKAERVISGYASSEADAYQGMACIRIENILSDGGFLDDTKAEIRFTDGSLAAAPSVRLTGDNTLTIKIEENGEENSKRSRRTVLRITLDPDAFVSDQEDEPL